MLEGNSFVACLGGVWVPSTPSLMLILPLLKNAKFVLLGIASHAPKTNLSVSDVAREKLTNLEITG